MNVQLTMAALTIACLAVAGCGGSASSSTPAAEASGNPCQMLSAWKSGGGTSGMNAITSDLAKLETAASAQSITALASAGQALDNDAQNAALDLPPIGGSNYISAMADFQTAGTDFATGIQSSAEAGRHRSRLPARSSRTSPPACRQPATDHPDRKPSGSEPEGLPSSSRPAARSTLLRCRRPGRPAARDPPRPERSAARPARWEQPLSE
jgi:hypothetical protein